jgi:hypothetical protein
MPKFLRNRPLVYFYFGEVTYCFHPGNVRQTDLQAGRQTGGLNLFNNEVLHAAVIYFTIKQSSGAQPFCDQAKL